MYCYQTGDGRDTQHARESSKFLHNRHSVMLKYEKSNLPLQYLLWDRVKRGELREDDLQLSEFRTRDNRIRSRIVNRNSGRLV